MLSGAGLERSEEVPKELERRPRRGEGELHRYRSE